jgi:predicted nucleic acid-binding protein
VIIVDTNIITYLFIEGENTTKAESVIKKDTEWAAPILWRSEFRNVLAFYMQHQNLKLEKAIKIMNEAVHLMNEHEYDVISLDVLQLAGSSGCSAYDCEFVALAKDIGVSLVTSDKKVLKAFPQYTTSLDNYIR